MILRREPHKYLLKKALCLFTLAVILSGTVFGCAYRYKGTGLRVGFSYDSHWQEVMCAVSSDTTVFDANAVALTFHFSLLRLDIETPASVPGYAVVGFGLYFAAEKGKSSNPQVDDYKNGEDCVFIKEITVAETATGAYVASQSVKKGKTFTHQEDFAVPPALLSYPSGTVYFEIALVEYAEEARHYNVHKMGGIDLRYEFISAAEVKFFNE
ncbi:MAG: hypothetical protein LBM78_03710 [Clostridiales bacterium]|jgi:hypothetical protein|nr:hypothetical protein [Clostridiales bacterium]